VVKNRSSASAVRRIGRIVKELRLRGIDTIDGAKAYAPAFMADFDARFIRLSFNLLRRRPALIDFDSRSCRVASTRSWPTSCVRLLQRWR